MFSGLTGLFRRSQEVKSSLLVDPPTSPLYTTADGRVAVVSKTKPAKPVIHLESLPPEGLISVYGVHAAQTADDQLDHYSEGFSKKFEMWKSHITRQSSQILDQVE